jgi:Holliday junction resolvasome RuvABC endonuclease subunit
MGNTLALDIGTTTGWAIRKPEAVLSGSWLLATPKELRHQRKLGEERTGDLRFFRLRDRIEETVRDHLIENIVFEDVLFLSSQAQSQLWASLRAAVWMAGESHRVECVHTGTLKKFATGAGNARKEAMIATVANLPPPWGRLVRDDNEADAVLILRWWETRNDPCSMCASLHANPSFRGK